MTMGLNELVLETPYLLGTLGTQIGNGYPLRLLMGSNPFGSVHLSYTVQSPLSEV